MQQIYAGVGKKQQLAFNKNNVPIQYRIQGASVLLPVKTYTTTVVYTISN
jgi:hypothetical protein